MRLIPPPPAWPLPLRRPPDGRAAGLAAVPVLAAGHLLAVASIGQVISNTTVWIVGILAGLATLFFTVGGVRYLMAGGDPAEVEKAKTAFKSAGIGYALALLAPVVVTVLRSLVGG
jgi:Type IV secretion system pilin